MTLSELAHSLLVRNESRTNWDTAWREKLVSNQSIMVKQLWQVGINEIFVDGSFVEDKDHPNDIDGYFECDLKERNPEGAASWYMAFQTAPTGHLRYPSPIRWLRRTQQLRMRFGTFC